MSKFKVGDKVRRIESFYKDNDERFLTDGTAWEEVCNRRELKLNGIVTIEALHSNNQIYLSELNGWGYWDEEKFELVKAKPKFEIGAKVKVIAETVEHDRHLIGMIGTVVDYTVSDNYNVEFETSIEQHANKVNDTTHTFHGHEIELVKESFRCRFKVGDKIRCINNTDKPLTEHRDYEVCSIPENYKIIVSDNNGETLICAEGRFLLAEDTSKFKVGDRIKVINTVDYLDLTGKLGTIIETNRDSDKDIAIEFDESFSASHDCDGKCKSDHGRYGKSSEVELITPEEKLINTEKMEIDEIKKFDKTILKDAEKEATEEIAKEKTYRAKRKFMELMNQVDNAKTVADAADANLADLKKGLKELSPKAE